MEPWQTLQEFFSVSTKNIWSQRYDLNHWVVHPEKSLQEKFLQFLQILCKFTEIYLLNQGNFFIHEGLSTKNSLNKRFLKIYLAQFLIFFVCSFFSFLLFILIKLKYVHWLVTLLMKLCHFRLKRSFQVDGALLELPKQFPWGYLISHLIIVTYDNNNNNNNNNNKTLFNVGSANYTIWLKCIS